MSYLFGTGWWILWYGLLWLALVPYVVMAAALTRATPDAPMMVMEQAFAVSSLSVFVLMIGTAISGIMWSAGAHTVGVWPWVRNVGGAVIAALLIGFLLVFWSGYYAVTPKLPMMNRWFAQIVCVTSAALMVAFCLHATWRFRNR